MLCKKNKNINNYKDYGTLIKVSYSCSGDMLGNVSEVSLDLIDNKVEYLYADSHDEPVIKTTYKVDNEKLKNIKKLVDAYNLADLEKLDIDDRLFVYDACSPTLSLVYKTGSKDYNKEYYSISYYYNIDIIRRIVINDVRDKLYDLLDNNNIIESTLQNDD